MTSKDNSSSEHALIDMIYRHLKENGYKKAAVALKKHAPQVETSNVKVSLVDIFQKWMSGEKKSDEQDDFCKSSVPKPATNATHNTSSNKKVTFQTIAAARNQERKTTKTETIKSSSAVKGSTTEQISTGEDSDSDSSLDVEKWKRLALQLSDADIAKVDIVTKVSTSTAKAPKKRTPAQPKKKQDRTIENNKPAPKKSKTKNSTKKSDKVKTPLKPPASSVCESDKVKTPPNKAIIAENNVKSPESKMLTNLSDQVATPKTDVSHALSESNRIKAKRKKLYSISESDNNETPSKKAETEKADVVSELKLTDTPRKQKKSKTNGTKPESSFTDLGAAIQKSQCGLNSSDLSGSNSWECVSHSKTGETKLKKDKSKKVNIVVPVDVDISIETNMKDATGSLTPGQFKIDQVLDFDPAENPTRKSKTKKSKKSKELQEPGDMATPSGEGQTKVDNEMFQKPKKSKESLFEAIGTERPSKKMEIQAATSILEPLSSETPSKKSKTKKGSVANHGDSPSIKDVADVMEGEASENSSSKPDKFKTSSKKSKRKRTDSSGEDVTSEWDNSGVGDNLRKSTEGQDQEIVSAVEENGDPEPKKRKKKKKDKKKMESDEKDEEVPPTPPSEDLLLSVQKKNKEKKHKHRDEETQVFTPATEEDSPKKKKKSSKEKEQADV